MTALAVGELARLDRVTCSYGPDAVLVNVDLSVGTDQFTGIVGPSGSGKTILLRVLLGTVAPLAGSVRRRPGLRIGYVPQVETVNWSFPVTVSECVLMARTRGRILPWRSRAEQAEVDEILDRLGIAALSGRHIRRLSGGQQQRVFIARALLGRPHLLLMDEPTSGVDVRTRHEVLHLLDDLHHDGLAVILTTHDRNGIASHLPHLVCLNVEVIGAGAPRDVLIPDVLERAECRSSSTTTPAMTTSSGSEGPEPDVGDLLRPYDFEFFRNAVMVATLAGGLCGLVGVYVVLKGISYIGHGLSHAIFGGFAASALLGVNFILGAGRGESPRP